MQGHHRLAPPPFRRRNDVPLLGIVETVRSVLDPDFLELELAFHPEGKCYRRRFVGSQATAAVPVRKPRVRQRESSALTIAFRLPDLLDGTLTLVRRARRPWTGAESMRFAILRPFVAQLLEAAARLEMEGCARERLLAAADGAEMPLLFLDGTGGLRYANPAAEALLFDPNGGEPAVLSDDGRKTPLLSHLLRLTGTGPPAKKRLALTDGRFFEARLFSLARQAHREDEQITVVTMREHAALTIDDVSAQLSTCGVSDREADVIGAVLQGMRNAEIAAELFITEWTVKDHLKHVFRKLGVRSRGGLLKALYTAPRGGVQGVASARRPGSRPQPIEGSPKPDLKM